MRGACVTGRAADEGEAVHAAEHEVDEHQVDLLVVHGAQRFLGVGVLDDLVPLVLEGEREGAADPVVVLEHQQPCRHGHHAASRRRARAPAEQGRHPVVMEPQTARTAVRNIARPGCCSWTSPARRPPSAPSWCAWTTGCRPTGWPSCGPGWPRCSAPAM